MFNPAQGNISDYFKGVIVCPFLQRLTWFLGVLMKFLQHTLVKIQQGSSKIAPSSLCLKQPRSERPVLRCAQRRAPALPWQRLSVYLGRNMAAGDCDTAVHSYHFESESNHEQEELENFGFNRTFLNG